MRPDYEADETVRRARLLGWVGSLLMGILIVAALGWKMAQVGEKRAMDATRENLAASLNALTAEQMVKDRAPEAAWRKLNPFLLLRWQQDNYCGELSLEDQPQRGCWYWLPAKDWVIYRARYMNDLMGGEKDVRVWRLLVIPDEMPAAAPGTAFSLELEMVSAEEQSTVGL